LGWFERADNRSAEPCQQTNADHAAHNEIMRAML
jgi:hypothetical protein